MEAQRGKCGLRMMLRSIGLGLLASLFFAVTFVLNETMSLAGGSWMWSASLRYLFMIPLLFVVVLSRGTLCTVFVEMRRFPVQWVVWSTVGFGLFYIPLCIAADYAPSWLVAASWQFTIIAGSMLTPLFHHPARGTGNAVVRMRAKLPIRGMLMSTVIFAGILVMEVAHAQAAPWQALVLGSLPILVAAFAYPLGNRKMMALCQGRLGAIERVFGMTVASLPLWILLSLVGVGEAGVPPLKQVEDCLVVAICSGVIATVLFFAATDGTKGNVHQLAAVEATQSGEVVFTVLLNLLLVSSQVPSLTSWAGVALIVIGMIGHSLWTAPSTNRHRSRSPAVESSDGM